MNSRAGSLWQLLTTMPLRSYTSAEPKVMIRCVAFFSCSCPSRNRSFIILSASFLSACEKAPWCINDAHRPLWQNSSSSVNSMPVVNLSNAAAIDFGLYSIPIGLTTTLNPQSVNRLPIFSAKHDPNITMRELWSIVLFGLIFIGVVNFIFSTFNLFYSF